MTWYWNLIVVHSKYSHWVGVLYENSISINLVDIDTTSFKMCTKTKFSWSRSIYFFHMQWLYNINLTDESQLLLFPSFFLPPTVRIVDMDLFFTKDTKTLRHTFNTTRHHALTHNSIMRTQFGIIILMIILFQLKNHFISNPI